MSADHKSNGLFDALEGVTEKVGVLIREEIELAKAELSRKVKKFVGGVVVAVSAGVFLVLALIYFGHALSWGVWQVSGFTTNYWFGFAVVGILLVIFGLIAGLVAGKLFKSSTPPTPELAIHEAQLIKDSIHPKDGPDGSPQSGSPYSSGPRPSEPPVQDTSKKDSK